MKQFIKFMFASALGTFVAVLLIITFFVAMMVGTVMNMKESEVGTVSIEHTL